MIFYMKKKVCNFRGSICVKNRLPRDRGGGSKFFLKLFSHRPMKTFSLFFFFATKLKYHFYSFFLIKSIFIKNWFYNIFLIIHIF